MSVYVSTMLTRDEFRSPGQYSNKVLLLDTPSALIHISDEVLLLDTPSDLIHVSDEVPLLDTRLLMHVVTAPF